MNDIQTLEKQLEDLKKQDNLKKWNIYLDNVKHFLDHLKGKTLLTHTSNYSFIIYKVLGYKEAHDTTSVGFYGQWHRKRWIEIETTPTLVCYYENKKVGNKFTTLESIASNYTFIRKRKSEVLVHKIEFNSGRNTYDLGGREVTKIGYDEFNSDKDPEWQRSLDKFLMFTTIVDNEMWDDAYKIYEQQAEMALNFWNKYNSGIAITNPTSNYFPK